VFVDIGNRYPVLNSGLHGESVIYGYVRGHWHVHSSNRSGKLSS